MTRPWGVADCWQPRRRRDVWCTRCMLVVMALIAAVSLATIFGPGIIALMMSPPR